MPDIDCVLDARSLLGEGALWDAATQRLWWVDIKRREIHRFDPATGRDECWPTPEDVGSLAVRRDGGLVAAMASGFFLADPEAGAFRHLIDPEADLPENRFNDGKPDRQGRFWAGSLHEPETVPTGGLYRLDPDLSCRRLVEGIHASNGLAFSPDGRILYYADSRARTVWAWDLDPDDGAIANRRVFIALQEGEGVPDGATVDAEGCYWLTQPSAWRVVRYDPRGRVDRTIMLPVEVPTCPAFGGPDLATLYVVTARWKLGPEALARQPLAGGLFAIDAGVKGLPEARFAG